MMMMMTTKSVPVQPPAPLSRSKGGTGGSSSNSNNNNNNNRLLSSLASLSKKKKLSYNNNNKNTTNKSSQGIYYYYSILLFLLGCIIIIELNVRYNSDPYRSLSSTDRRTNTAKNKYESTIRRYDNNLLVPSAITTDNNIKTNVATTTTTTTSTSDTSTMTGTGTDTTTTIISSSGYLAYVPIKEPYNVCYGQIEKLVCQKTILIETNDPIPKTILQEYSTSSTSSSNTKTRRTNTKDNDDIDNDDNIDNDNDDDEDKDTIIMNTMICPILLNLKQSVTGIVSGMTTNNNNTTKSKYTVVRVPVCIQTYTQIGIIVHVEEEEEEENLDDEYNENDNESYHDGSMDDFTTVREMKRLMEDDDEEDTTTDTLSLIQSFDTSNNSNNGIIVQELVNKIISWNITNTKLTIRIVPLKRLDFTAYYKIGIHTTPNHVERFRDNNYGNMVWRYASTRLLNPITNEIDINDQLSKNNFTNRPSIDAMIIATANTFHLSKRKPKLQSLIETITQRVRTNNVPTIVLGVGIQMSFDDKLLHNMNRNPLVRNSTTITGMEPYVKQLNIQFTQNYQKQLVETITKYQSSPAIGVRGDLTKSVCTNANIHNCIAMGCPSLTISRDINLGTTLQTKWDILLKDRLNNYAITTTTTTSSQQQRQSAPIKIALTCPAEEMESSLETIVSILEAFGVEHVTIITQINYDATMINTFVQNKWNKLYPQTTLRDITKIQYVEYQNIETWLYDARTKYDVCISFRIHGSMTFLGSGIPTVVIPTDFRIMELIYAMKLPYILPTELTLLVQNHLQQLKASSSYTTSTTTYKPSTFVSSLLQIAYTNTDFGIFEQNRRNKLQGWKDILHVANLEMDPSLLRIISSSSL